MLSDTTLDWFIREWRKALSEHSRLGYPSTSPLWRVYKQLPQGAAQRGSGPTEEDSADVEFFVMAVHELRQEKPNFYRAFIAKYLDTFDGVVDHKPRKDKEKASRLDVSTSTFSEQWKAARKHLKAYIEKNWYS